MGQVLGRRDVRLFLLAATTACLAGRTFAQSAVPTQLLNLNELNVNIEEQAIPLPEYGQDSPFRAISQPKTISEDPVIQTVRDAVDSTRRRLLSVERNSPWQIMHGLLSLRQEFQVRQNGEIISGLDWVSTGPTYDGVRWFEKTRHGGRAQPYSRPYAFEGHANQFLAILSMSGLPLSHEFQTDDGPITMKDMLRHAQQSIDERDEVTWTLWALSRYLPPDAAWLNEKGEPWSIERMMKIQVDDPLQGAPCGGTHGLFALAHARNVYLRHGQPLRGVWLEAEYKIRTYINTARMQQNSDGSLSSNFFRGREYKQDFNKRMASAGHVLEFLMIALPQEQLQEQWVRRALHASAVDLMNNRKAYVKCSPLYHTVNGLSIYLDRVKTESAPAEMAAGKKETRTAKADSPTATATDGEPESGIPAVSISIPQPANDADSAEIPEDEDPADESPESNLEQPLDDVASGDKSGDQAKWRATLKSRRTPIALDEDKSPELLLPIPVDAGI